MTSVGFQRNVRAHGADDIRHIQSIVRTHAAAGWHGPPHATYLGKLLINRGFSEQLDVRHEHLIPFANGVLDLDALVLRPGRPSDMLLRGPSYAWVDFPESDALVEELGPSFGCCGTNDAGNAC